MDEQGDKNARKRPYNRKGQSGFLPGNPGRPLGCKSKFTLIKSEIADLWKDAGMKARLKALIKADPKEAREILKVIASLLPKDDPNDGTPIEPLTIRIEDETTDHPQTG